MTEEKVPSTPAPTPRPRDPRRRAWICLGALAGFSLAAWGVARGWEWQLHQPALAHHRRAESLYAEGKIGEALEEWEAATLSEPWWPDPYFRLAEGLQSINQPNAAVLVLRKVAGANPRAEHLQCRLAEAYGALADRVGSEAWAAAAVKKEPRCARAHLIYARTHAGRLAETLEHYQKALELSGNDAIRLELAKVHAQSGDLKSAEADLTGYLAGHPANVETHYLQGYILARRARDPQTVQEAAKHLQAVLQAEPGRYDAHAELGLLYERRREWASARRHFEAARKLNPGSATILFHLSTVLRQLRDPAASRLLEQVKSIQAKERRWREARRELLSQPRNIPLMLEVARLSLDLGAPQLAQSFLQSVLLADPKNQEARRMLEKSQPSAALSNQEKADP